jgi:hypothetical protein
MTSGPAFDIVLICSRTVSTVSLETCGPTGAFLNLSGEKKPERNRNEREHDVRTSDVDFVSGFNSQGNEQSQDDSKKAKRDGDGIHVGLASYRLALEKQDFA